MSDTKKKTTNSGALAVSILDAFAAWCARQPAEDGGGGLVGQLAARFKAEQGDSLTTEIDEAIENLVAVRQRKLWEAVRQHPFERVLVKRIAHLFPKEGELSGDGTTVSRRLLPGLQQAVEMMIGHDDLVHHRKACQELLKDLRARAGEDFDWDTLYDHVEANDLVDDVLAQGIGYLDDVEKRVDWFRRLVNSHLAPPENYMFEGERAAIWTLDVQGSRRLMAALFARLRKRSDDPVERSKLEERHGKDALERLRRFHDGLMAGL